nr:MATE family efflux transporter [Maliibacterium massiliense]
MGTMPVPKLLITMSLPIMISMLVQALYNIVDSIFVAQYSDLALTAVSLAFPIQMLMISVAVGTGVGINSLLSRRLGERNYEDANHVATNGLFLMVMSTAAFALLGGFFSRAFFEMFSDNPQIVAYGTQYLFICSVFSFGIFLQVAFERLMQATGVTIYNLVMQGSGAVINIILDPILIFGWGFIPSLGVAGAAIATVVGQIAGAVIGLFVNLKKNREVSLSFKGFRPYGRIIKEIYRVGVPSIIMQSIGSVMTVGLNKILIMFSEVAVSVLGVYFKLQSFVFMPVLGMSNALIPIVGFNYGAKRKERINVAIRWGCILAVSIMLLGMAVFQLFAKELLMMFNADANMLAIGVPALRIISLSFTFAGVCITFSSVFQAVGNGLYSMIVSVVRQLVFILPAAYILAELFGLSAVWYAFPMAECVSLLLSVLFFRRVYRKRVRDLELTDEEDLPVAEGV